MSKEKRPAEQSILMRKHGKALAPTDERGIDVLAKLGDGDVMVWVQKPRNPKRHRLFFALVGKIYENQSVYQSRDHLLNAIKVGVGHCEMMVTHDGKAIYVPKSIAFDAMDDLEFAEFLDRVIHVVTTRIIPNLKPGDLRRELEGFTRENPMAGFRDTSAITRGLRR